MKESDNDEDDKVYLFFTERAQEAEGPAGKVLYTRVARVCKVCVCVCILSLLGLCACISTCMCGGGRAHLHFRPTQMFQQYTVIKDLKTQIT